MFHTRLIHILVTFLFSTSCTQLFELFPQYPTLRPRLLSGTLLSRQRLKSGKWISWCFFFIYCECCFVLGPPSLKYIFFVLYSTTLVHCWLEFMKAVMSLRRVNSNCVTRSYFFFPSAIYFIFPWYKKKSLSALQVKFCLPFNKVTLQDTLAMSPFQRRSFDLVDKNNVWEMELCVSQGSSSTSS